MRLLPGTLFGLCLLAAPALARGGGEQADKSEKVIRLDEVPPEARATIEKESKGQTITKLEREEEDGKVLYEAHLRSPSNEKSEIEVSADGKLLKREHEEEHER